MNRTLKQCVDRIKPLCEARGMLNYREIREIFNDMEGYAQLLHMLWEESGIRFNDNYVGIYDTSVTDREFQITIRSESDSKETVLKWLEELE